MSGLVMMLVLFDAILPSPQHCQQSLLHPKLASVLQAVHQ